MTSAVAGAPHAISRGAGLRLGAVALGFFLLVLGAKLYLIGAFGSPLPWWDQWGQEAQRTYKPWIEGRFGLPDLFARAGVHRRVWSRLLALGLLVANREQWDPLVQQIVQGALHAGVMTGSALLVGRRLGSGALTISFGLLGAFLVCPFGWHDTLWGYESHFYFLAGFSVLAVSGLALHDPRALAWWVGLVAAACATVAAASGFLAGAASGATAALLGLRGRRPWRSLAGTVVAGVVLVGAGIWLMRFEGWTEGNNFRLLRGGSTTTSPLFVRAGDLLGRMGRVVGWPLPVRGAAGWLLYAPLGLVAWRWLRRSAASESSSGSLARAEALLVALGLWSLLQAVGISVLRGGAESRHRDMLIFGPWLNALAWLWLLRGESEGRAKPKRRRGRALALAAACAAWVAALGAGFVHSAREVCRVELPRWRSELSVQLDNVRLFLATNDASHLEGKPRDEAPHPRPRIVVELLRDPGVRALLPAALRDPLPLRPDPRQNGPHTWAAAAVPPSLVPPTPAPEVPVVGSYLPPTADAGGTGVRQWRSEPLATKASALRFAVAGGGRLDGGAGGGPAASVRLVDADSGAVLRELPLERISPATWGEVQVPAPRGGRRFRIDARAPGGPSAGWLALAAPREVGPLSRWIVPLSDPVAAGSCLLLGAVLLLVASRPRARRV